MPQLENENDGLYHRLVDESQELLFDLMPSDIRSTWEKTEPFTRILLKQTFCNLGFDGQPVVDAADSSKQVELQALALYNALSAADRPRFAAMEKIIRAIHIDLAAQPYIAAYAAYLCNAPDISSKLLAETLKEPRDAVKAVMCQYALLAPEEAEMVIANMDRDIRSFFDKLNYEHVSGTGTAPTAHASKVAEHKVLGGVPEVTPRVELATVLGIDKLLDLDRTVNKQAFANAIQHRLFFSRGRSADFNTLDALIKAVPKEYGEATEAVTARSVPMGLDSEVASAARKAQEAFVNARRDMIACIIGCQRGKQSQTTQDAQPRDELARQRPVQAAEKRLVALIEFSGLLDQHQAKELVRSLKQQVITHSATAPQR